MALQRTPPFALAHTSSSNPDIPSTVELDNFIRCKRKQPESDFNLDFLQQKFDKQMTLWNEQVGSCFKTSIVEAVSSAVSSELGKITSILAELNTNVKKLNEENLKINTALVDTNRRLDELEKYSTFSADRQDSLETRIACIEKKTTVLSDSTSQFQVLQNKIALLEQQARSCNVEIANLPEKKAENLLLLVDSLGREIKHPIQRSDVVAINRVPHANQQNPRPKNIIVKFTTKMVRDNFIAAYRANKGVDSSTLNISGPSHTIYVNEHLTLSNKILFRQCREAAKNKYKYVWVKHGTILARKDDTSAVIAIRSAEDIKRIA